jgi:hypothetical protein
LKKIIIIAGPNGAGKTTFAREFLPAEAQTLRFLNADLIAAGLAPFNPESASFKAGRLMLEAIDECVEAGHSFAFETTLSGMVYLKKISLWQAHVSGCRFPRKSGGKGSKRVTCKAVFAGARRASANTALGICQVVVAGGQVAEVAN